MKAYTKETLGLMREIYRAYKAEMAAVARYTYGQILFEKTHPALSDLFASIARAEMRHYHILGELLRDLGVSHALKVNLQDFAYRFEGNDNESALRAAHHFLRERIKEERTVATAYQHLAGVAAMAITREMLSALSQEEADHAAALEAALLRLSAS